jgi:hypothetical protein
MAFSQTVGVLNEKDQVMDFNALVEAGLMG